MAIKVMEGEIEVSLLTTEEAWDILSSILKWKEDELEQCIEDEGDFDSEDLRSFIQASRNIQMFAIQFGN